MTTITVKVSSFVTDWSAPPQDPLAAAVSTSMTIAAKELGVKKLVPERVVYTDSNQPVEGWPQEQQRLLGSQPITVDCSQPKSIAEQLHDMAQQLKSLQSSIELRDKRDVLRDERIVREVAAKILRVVCGVDDFQGSKSRRFATLAWGPGKQSVVQLAGNMQVEVAKLVEQAGAVLDRRNAPAHPGSLSELDDEVETIAQLITPAHQRRYPWECRFITHYDQVKKAFPGKFVAD